MAAFRALERPHVGVPILPGVLAAALIAIAPTGASPRPQQSAAPSADERDFQSAVADFDAQRYADADRKLRPLAERLPDNFEVNELLGLVCAAEGQDDRADRYLNRAVRLKPAAAAARANLAVHLAHLGKTAAAETEFKKAVELEPASYDANHNLGELYLKAGKLTAAIPYLERAQTASPSYENGYDLALAYADTGQP
ncbi:MAG TPA: tetratricopeptide repeat protein, partial [Terriglobia bacterium]|nr:tetratricopeptide repeat protein [Terriglobia bacterium]